MRSSKWVTFGLGAAMVVAAAALITQYNQLVAQGEQLTAQRYQIEAQNEQLRAQTERFQAQMERTSVVNASVQQPQLASQSELPVVVVSASRSTGLR
jgi:hypothetical protein